MKEISAILGWKHCGVSVCPKGWRLFLRHMCTTGCGFDTAQLRIHTQQTSTDKTVKLRLSVLISWVFPTVCVLRNRAAQT